MKDKGPLRRWLAMVALVAGLGAAWWQSERGVQSLELALLLTHVEVPVGAEGVALDRSELVSVTLRPGPGRSQTLHFSAGSAPEATTPLTLEVPSATTHADVRCVFRLPTGTEVRSHGRVKLPEAREGVQVVDLGTCGALRSPAP